MPYKVIAAHPGKQHSFRLATALKKEGLLFKYMTTVYDKQSSWLMRLTKHFLGADNLKRANTRKCDALPDEDVVQFCEFIGLIDLLLLRIDKTKKLYRWWNQRTAAAFGRRVAEYAIRNNVDAVIMYDNTATEAFELLQEKAPHIKRILDTSIANRLFMKDLFRQIIDSTDDPTLQYESDYFWSQTKIDRLARELAATDAFLIPSEFVRRSLAYSGVPDGKIYKVPYGANLNMGAEKTGRIATGAVTFLFVGQCVYRKGINYLLKAFSELAPQQVKLILVGGVDESAKYFRHYADCAQIEFCGHVTHDRMRQFYAESDVFIFPSLAEGMTLAGLEAMGCGLPIICTSHSGVDELVVEGENGFIIPICDCEAIKEKALWFVSNRERIPAMGEKARQAAAQYTWEKYSANVVKAVEAILRT